MSACSMWKWLSLVMTHVGLRATVAFARTDINQIRGGIMETSMPISAIISHVIGFLIGEYQWRKVYSLDVNSRRVINEQ